MRKILHLKPVCSFSVLIEKLCPVLSYIVSRSRLILFAFFLLLTSNNFKLRAQDFVTTWQTNVANEIIVLPNSGIAADYNFNIDWGDGTVENNITNPLHQHTYVIPGIYTVRINGQFERFNFEIVPTNVQNILSVEQWGGISVSELNFRDAINFQINATDNPDLSRVITFQNIFNGATSVNADLSGWIVNNGLITNMSGAFLNATAFNGNISTWIMTDITDTSQMFDGASSFNGMIGGWDVSNVTNMERMFTGALAFNQDISGWITAAVMNMDSMFSNAAIFNQNIGGWNTINVSNMSFMFNQASAFNQDISGWNTQNVTDMSFMFASASNFNQDIGNWTVSSVTDMSSMFSGNPVFNQDLSGWVTSSLQFIDFIFSDALAFNQSLGNWDIQNVSSMFNALSNSGLSTSNYDATLIGWNAQTVQSNVFLGAQGLTYCLSNEARENLIVTNLWAINGDSFNCDSVLNYSIVASSDAVEGTSDAVFTISIDGGINNTSGVDITGTITLTGTATSGVDYTTVTTFTIAQGTNSVLITVPVLDDIEVEPIETIIATISAPNIGIVNMANDMATATISDDDGASLVYSITASSDAVEGTSDATFTVSIDGGITNTTGADITGTIALTGTATNGVDYTNVTTFTIVQGTNSVLITVPVLDDTEIEPIETIIATISAPSIGSVNMANNMETATISDDDVFIPNPNLALSKTGTYIDTNADGILNIGDQIEYAFSVENNGNEDVTNIVISDPLPGITLNGGPINLQVGEVDNSTFTGIYNITEEDLSNGSVVNQAFAMGQDPNGIEIIDFSDDPNNDTNDDDDGDGDGEDPTITTLLEEDIFIIYEIITPNGDGLNDEFRIAGLNKFPENSLIIYNRWGAKVFQAEGYEQKGNDLFNGFAKNQNGPLPSGTYYFILEYKNLTGTMNNKSGYVYIN